MKKDVSEENIFILRLHGKRHNTNEIVLILPFLFFACLRSIASGEK